MTNQQSRTPFGDRLFDARKSAKLTQKELASKVGMSQSALAEAEKTGQGSQYLAQLARALGVQSIWLATGKGPREQSASVTPFDANAVIIPIGTRRVPLISSIQAGLWSEIVDNFAPGDAEEWLITDLKCSDASFALTIKGNSMEPIFSDGDRVIIDPAVIPRPGSFVAAKNGSEEATFKKYRPRGISANGQDVFELVPLNDDYPSLHSDREPIRIIGTAVEHRRRLG